MEEIKTQAIIILIVLLASCSLLNDQPNLKAQSSPNIVNVPLTFHDYSLILRDPNGSFCVYDGADGASPVQANAVQTNLVSQISGTYSGFRYWSADIIWATKLTRDLHVQGTVNVRVFISSTFPLSGFFSGGGYAMGLVDIDQNNNEIQEFITQGPQSIGSNPFTQTPTQYSINTNVDYIFKSGHSIGFAIGLGATTQGFTATVYFDSADKNSGATLPIQDTQESYTFNANYNGLNQNIVVVSNSAISNYQYDSTKTSIQFVANLINYTNGYCNVYIPKTLMQTPFTITSNAHTITPTLTQNSTHYQLYFTHIRNPNPIQIAGTAISSTATPTASSTSEPTGTPTTSPNPTATGPETSTQPTNTAEATTHPTASSSPSASTKPTITPAILPNISEYSFIAFIIAIIIIAVFVGILGRKRTTN
jgi:hypothetical protein